MRSFSEWIRDKYFEYQKQTGKVSSKTAFARHLGVSQQNLSNWINGDTKPSDHKNIQALVNKYGDEAYEVLGMKPPAAPIILGGDARLNLLNRVWELLPEAMKQEFADKAGRVKEQRRDGRKTKSGK